MKFLLPILSGTTSIVLASTFFLSTPIKKTFIKKTTEEIKTVGIKEDKILSKQIILRENEVENRDEIKIQKKKIVDIVYEMMEVKTSKTKDFLQEINVKDENILEQIPAEKPKWIFETPEDNTKQTIYFIGESIGEEKYETALEKAKLNSMIELCQFIKKRIEFDTQKIKETQAEEFNQKLVKKIASMSKNTFMRESRIIDRCYLKLKPDKNIQTPYFQMFVLLSYPRKNIEESVKEGLIYEKEMLQNLATEEELKKIQEKIENSGKENKEMEIKKQMDQERNLLFSQNRIENLYYQSIRAEEFEKKGKILAAYREYTQILDKIKTILNTK